MMYKHGIVPDDSGKGIVIPLIKYVDGNRFTTDNYRGITLSPIISKLFEIVLLSHFFRFLAVWFKSGYSGTSCSHAIFTFKTVVDHYVRNGSAVSVCALDISKAFDRVDHYKMLNVLMDRSLPRQFIGVFSGWLAKCFVCVRWGSTYSCWFQILAGVGQGGIYCLLYILTL